jgi:uncharacterized membrane protein YobD (UPF0266 family)
MELEDMVHMVMKLEKQLVMIRANVEKDKEAIMARFMNGLNMI